MDRLSKLLKRVMDVAGAAAAAAVAAPLMAIAAVAVWASMGRPLIFVQERTGKDGRTFRCLKFRTMLEAGKETGAFSADGERLTRTGALLRATSIDELPQLWNVLRGDMSLVGPRPLLPGYLARYTAEQRRRHEVRPGITGWAQVNGRNGLTWEQKFKLDVWYVDNWSLWLDLKIIFMTVFKVVRREGVSQRGHATMPEFMGTSGNEPATAART